MIYTNKFKVHNTKVLDMIRQKDHVDGMGDKIWLDSMELWTYIVEKPGRQWEKESVEFEERSQLWPQRNSFIDIAHQVFQTILRNFNVCVKIDTIKSSDQQMLMGWVLHKKGVHPVHML